MNSKAGVKKIYFFSCFYASNFLLVIVLFSLFPIWAWYTEICRVYICVMANCTGEVLMFFKLAPSWLFFFFFFLPDLIMVSALHCCN